MLCLLDVEPCTSFECVLETEEVADDAVPLLEDVDEVGADPQEGDSEREESRDGEDPNAGRVDPSNDQEWDVLCSNSEHINVKETQNTLLGICTDDYKFCKMQIHNCNCTSQSS